MNYSTHSLDDIKCITIKFTKQTSLSSNNPQLFLLPEFILDTVPTKSITEKVTDDTFSTHILTIFTLSLLH